MGYWVKWRMLLLRMLQVFNKVRVWFILNFYSGYARRILRERKGECKKCGSCCLDCCLLGEEKFCTAYFQRPKWCHRDFPLDPFDLWTSGLKEKCGYWWK